MANDRTSRNSRSAGSGSGSGGTSDTSGDTGNGGAGPGRGNVTGTGDAAANGPGDGTGNGSGSTIGSGNGQKPGTEPADTGGAGTGAGTRTRRRGPRGPGSDAGSATGTQEKLAADGTPGLEDKPPRRTRRARAGEEPAPSLGVTTTEMLENAYGGAFWMWAQIAGIQELNLAPVERQQLAKETERTLRTLGTRRAKKIQKAINTYLPGVSLVVTALVLTVPRYHLQQRVKRGQYLRRVEPVQDTNRNGAATGAGNVTAAPGSDAASPDIGQQPAVWREVSVTGDDLDAISRRNTEHH